MQKLDMGPEFVSLLTGDIVNKPHCKCTPERSRGESCFNNLFSGIPLAGSVVKFGADVRQIRLMIRTYAAHRRECRHIGTGTLATTAT
jgi:hypothetical protein